MLYYYLFAQLELTHCTFNSPLTRAIPDSIEYNCRTRRNKQTHSWILFLLGEASWATFQSSAAWSASNCWHWGKIHTHVRSRRDWLFSACIITWLHIRYWILCLWINIASIATRSGNSFARIPQIHIHGFRIRQRAECCSLLGFCDYDYVLVNFLCVSTPRKKPLRISLFNYKFWTCVECCGAHRIVCVCLCYTPTSKCKWVAHAFPIHNRNAHRRTHWAFFVVVCACAITQPKWEWPAHLSDRADRTKYVHTCTSCGHIYRPYASV